MAKADQSTLVIKELTGLKRSVTLRGPSLPFQGAGWGGTQRVTTEWYPGNATEGTQHVLGPTEKPSTWTGFWRTNLMVKFPTLFREGGGTERRIIRASTLKDTLEDIFRLGQRLRVEWQNTQERSEDSDLSTRTHREVREGRPSDWDWEFERADDISWTVTFDWVSRGARQQRVFARRSDDVDSQIITASLAIDEAISKLEENPIARSVRTIEKSANKFSLGAIENFLDTPSQLVQQFTQQARAFSSRFKQVGELISKTRAIPTQLANQALDVANNTIAIANQFTDEMSRRPAEANVARTKASQLSTSSEFFGDATTQADVIKNSAQGLKTTVQSSADQEKTILAIHVVRGVVNIPGLGVSGEILNNISTRYYDTPDESGTIAKANNLPINQMFVDRGTMLIIPTLEAAKKFSPEGG